MSPRRLLPLALLLAALAAPTSSPRARDLTGRLGLGGQVESGALGATLSLKYWVSNLGLQALVGVDTRESGDGEIGYRELRLGARVLYALTRSRLTNLNVGVGLSSYLRDSKERDPRQLFLDLLVSPEIHLGDHFALAGQVTFTVELASNPARTLASGAWGAAFHYYF